MKSMQLPSTAIFFMTYFHRARGAMAPSPPPDPLLSNEQNFTASRVSKFNKRNFTASRVSNHFFQNQYFNRALSHWWVVKPQKSTRTIVVFVSAHNLERTSYIVVK